jgi:hypothetical protein
MHCFLQGGALMFLILECKNYICIYLELLFCIGNTVCDNDFEIILKILSFSGIIASIITILIVKITMVTEVVAVLVWRDDKFMICQRPAHKARGLLWEFVGGKVEPENLKNNGLSHIHSIQNTDIPNMGLDI